MLARLLLSSLAFACGPDSPRAHSVPATPTPALVEAPDAPDGDEAPLPGPAETAPEEPPAYGEGRLDAMRDAELEAACMQGSTAACDRLGH